MLITQLLLVCGAAAFTSIQDLPVEVGGYTFTSLGRSSEASKEPTELKITDNVLTLTRAEFGSSMSSTYVQALRENGSPELAALSKRALNGSVALEALGGGAVFLAKVNVGKQDFSVVIDTGSSDPWLIVSDFQCYDYEDYSPTTQDQCDFGPAYTRTSAFTVIANENFNISYADGEYLTGGMGTDTFVMAGISVDNQQFGVVNQAAWQGDGVSSGLVGFAYRSLTSAHAGSDPTQDKADDTIMYNPLFVNMYTNAGVPPVFSMAIDRDLSKGGVMAIGGLPNIPHAPYYASTPIQPVGVNITDKSLVYEFYTITVDGYAVSNSPYTQFNPYTNTNPLKTPLIGNNTLVIVDSGTSICYLPPTVVKAVSAAFSPPAVLNDDTMTWEVDCDATAAVFGVSIGGKVFYVNPVDMIINSDGYCYSSIQSSHTALSILGGTWMRNVIAVFDIGAELMHFAAREYYSIS